MNRVDKEYKIYCSLHHDFTVTYAEVNKRIIDFYPAPKKFLEETGPGLKQYVRDFSAMETNSKRNRVSEMIFYFSDSFSRFAHEMVRLYDDYKTIHIDSSGYMKKIFALKQNPKEPVADKLEFIRLTAEVEQLVTGLKQIGSRILAIEVDFKKLESEWQLIQEKVSA